jgi:hypothetical protein
MTALKRAKKSGGTASALLQTLSLEIQQVITINHLMVRYFHIQGVKNVRADYLSRQKKPLYEWTLPRRFFETVQQHWGRMTIDAFAARENKRLAKF